jgi:TctA family transporter
METLDSVGPALEALADPSVLRFIILGSAIGFFVGILPGLGATVALVLMLPFVFELTPFEAMAFMLSMIAVTGITGDFTSILFGIPGEATSVALVVDGHPLSKMGEAGRALAAALLSSMIGALVGGAALALALPVMRPLVLALGTPELFMLTVVGASLVGVLSGNSFARGIATAALGFGLATIGADPKTGLLRFTGGQLFLFDGLPLIPMTVGLFAVPELIELAISRQSIAGVGALRVRGVADGVRDVLKHWFLAVRCGILAVGVGVVPGLGGSVSQWVAYGHALQTSKEPQRFGHGAIEGVIGPGAANNAKDGGALIPLVGFGIPGSVQGTVLLGALLILGLSPGPEMVREHADVTLFMIFVLVLTSVAWTILLLPLLGQIAKVTIVKGMLLIPFVSVLIFTAAYSERSLYADAAIALLFGIVGWVMDRARWPRAALLLGFVLAERSETSLWLSFSLYGADWLSRPIVVGLAVIAVAVAWSAVRQRRAGEAALVAKATLDDEEVDTGPPYSSVVESAFAWLTVALFGAMLILSADWPPAARLFPSVMGIAGGVAAIIRLRQLHFGLPPTWSLSRGRLTSSASQASSTALWRSVGMILWLTSLFVLVGVVGFALAVPAFVFLYLVFEARERWWRAALLSAGAFAAFPGLLVTGLGMRVPDGLLGPLLPW